MNSRAWIILSNILFSGCTNKNNLINGNLRFDYSIEQSRSCFCPNGGKPVKLFVAADTIADALWLTDNTHLNPADWYAYRSIKGLFDEIKCWDTSSTYQVRIIYDSVIHYPSYVSFSPKPIIVNDTVVSIISDAGISYKTWNYERYK